MNDMVKVYQNSQLFLEENLSFLLRNKYASSLIVLNAKNMKDIGNSNYLIKASKDDKTLIACRLVPYNTLLYGDHECLDELLSFIKSNDYELPGIMCSTTIGDHLNDYIKVISMDFMEANEITEESSENIKIATLDDVDEIAYLSSLFFKECGLTDKVNREKIIERIDSYRLIKKDNKIISMARHSYDTETSDRISMVYTRKEYRGYHYAKEVVNSVKNEIIRDGKIATLNVDQTNPISNHLYSCLGFKKVFSQGIYLPK